MEFNEITLPGEIADLPACSKCCDDGVLEMGSDVQSTTFCDCDHGEETFEAWADAQSQAEFECQDIEEW